MIYVSRFVEEKATQTQEQLQYYVIAVLFTLMITYYIGAFEKKQIKKEFEGKIKKLRDSHNKTLNELSEEKDELKKKISSLKDRIIESEMEHVKQLNELQKKTNHHLRYNSKTPENEKLWHCLEESVQDLELYHERTYNKIKSDLK